MGSLILKKPLKETWIWPSIIVTGENCFFLFPWGKSYLVWEYEVGWFLLISTWIVYNDLDTNIIMYRNVVWSWEFWGGALQCYHIIILSTKITLFLHSLKLLQQIFWKEILRFRWYSYGIDDCSYIWYPKTSVNLFRCQQIFQRWPYEYLQHTVNLQPCRDNFVV